MKSALSVLGLALGVACGRFEPTEVPRASSAERGAFEIRLAQETPQAGLTPMRVEQSMETIYVASQAALTGNDVRRARIMKGSYGQVAIGVTFTTDGARRLADLTKANTGKRAAFLLNGRVVSAPRIQGPIEGGAAVIEGSFTKEEASRLAQLLSGD